MAFSLYEEAVVNQWRLNGNKCNISVLRDAYFEIYFQHHRNKRHNNIENIMKDLGQKANNYNMMSEARYRYHSLLAELKRFPDDESRQRHYMYQNFKKLGSWSRVYRILKKYGRKEPFNPGFWIYDPKHAESSLSQHSSNVIYYGEFMRKIINDIKEYLHKHDENSYYGRIIKQWNFKYVKPTVFGSGMTVNFSFSNKFMKIPFEIEIRQQSFCIRHTTYELRKKKEDHIFYHNTYGNYEKNQILSDIVEDLKAISQTIIK